MEIEPMRWHNPVSRAAAAAIHTYLRAATTVAATIHVYNRSAAAAAAAVAAALKFHLKHVTNKNKTKHIMNISHINIIYDKTTTRNVVIDRKFTKKYWLFSRNTTVATRSTTQHIRKHRRWKPLLKYYMKIKGTDNQG